MHNFEKSASFEGGLGQLELCGGKYGRNVLSAIWTFSLIHERSIWFEWLEMHCDLISATLILTMITGHSGRFRSANTTIIILTTKSKCTAWNDVFVALIIAQDIVGPMDILQLPQLSLLWTYSAIADITKNRRHRGHASFRVQVSGLKHDCVHSAHRSQVGGGVY